jgi:hypothetical protein
MKQVLQLVLLIVVTLASCKPKENTNTTNPSTSTNKVPTLTDPAVKISPLDRTPNASTGWTVPPCHLVDEEDIRLQLKIEQSIAMVPDLGANAQTITSCTFRWMKPSFETIEAENKKITAALAKKGGGIATLKPVVDVVTVSYTGKYNDAASATSAFKEIVDKDKLKSIPAIGDAAAWNVATNQMTVQKGNAIFYLVVEIDPKKNLSCAQILAAAAVGRVK